MRKSGVRKNESQRIKFLSEYARVETEMYADVPDDVSATVVVCTPEPDNVPKCGHVTGLQHILGFSACTQFPIHPVQCEMSQRIYQNRM
jgi:hypothetical protein